jgi:hypothetical protein
MTETEHYWRKYSRKNKYYGQSKLINCFHLAHCLVWNV